MGGFMRSITCFRYGLPLVQAVAVVLWAVPASAQDAPPPVPTAQTGKVEQVTVSARRRDETVQETPLAVTALSPSLLESKATMNLGDLQGSAPNILITEQNSGAAATNLSIRGLAFADIEKSFDPTVGVVLDGVFLGTSTGSYMDFFDIASMEVLRGPQGTLFGRNTIGGVINIKRTRPTGEFGGKFDASYGKFDTWAARGVLNVPIIKDVLAAKFFYFHNETEGFYRNAITGNRNGASNNENFGATFLLTPNDNFEALLTLEKQVKNYSPVNSNITNSSEFFCSLEPANECNRNSTTDLYTVFIQETNGRYRSPAATLEMNYDAGFIKLTSVTAYRESKEAQTQDFDAASTDLYFTDRRQSYEQFSQELRGAGNITDSFDYVAGVYYFKSKYNLFQHTRFTGFELPSDQDTTGHSESFAAFGDFNWRFADQWNLFFGGRWTHDQKQNQTSVFPSDFPHVTTSGSKFTPRVGVDWRPNDDIMIYASWSRGYRSGGFSGRGLTLFSSTTPYGPETVDSYEMGVKTAWFDDRLNFNVAAFYADYKSLQQSATIPLSGGQGNETIVINVGSATIKGIEAELTARPTEELTLTAAMGLLDSKFKNFIVPQGAVLFDYSAVDMIYAPKVTLSMGAEYAVPVSFGEIKANVNYRYVSRYDQQISLGPTVVDPSTGNVIVTSNDPRVRSNTHNLLDASLTVSFQLGEVDTHLTVYGRNLLDNRGPNAAFTVAGLWSFASAREPRTFGVQLGAEF